MINNCSNEIKKSNSELYVIAIGTNDVRSRNPSICAMNQKEYVYQIKKIIELAKNKQAKFFLIASWFSTSDDFISKLNHLDKIKLLKEYSLELKKFSHKNKYIFIDPNEYLQNIVLQNKSKYMIDYIHPNNKVGIELYCEAIFKSK